MLRIFLGNFFLVQMMPAVSLQYSYLGLVDSTDALGHPITVSRGEYEVGKLWFSESIPLPNVLGVSSFSFTTFTLESDSFGNPTLRLIEFSNDDVVFFDAGFSDGQIVTFELVAEASFGISSEEIFRCTVEPNLRGRLEKIEAGSAMIVSEGAVAVIPEPTPVFLLGLGLAALFKRGR